MHVAPWISKAKNTQSEYVIFIAVTLQQRLQEHASILRYTYVACLVVGYIEMLSVLNTM
jgi:hypothetical protein